MLLVVFVALVPAARLASTQTAAHPTRDCFIAARLGEPAPFVSDASECEHKSAPASTFKISHALLALQTAVITPETVFTWDGTPMAFDSWGRDHTLDSAMKSSVYPFFQRTARLIGRERMREGLASLGYAADTFDAELSTFWNTGDLVVSPREQFAFLQRLFAGTLPVDARHVSIVSSTLRMPAGRIVNASGVHSFGLDWPEATIVRAKTGNTRVNDESVSWLVGALELQGTHYVFVARARSGARLESTAGAEVARRELNKLARAKPRDVLPGHESDRGRRPGGRANAADARYMDRRQRGAAVSIARLCHGRRYPPLRARIADAAARTGDHHVQRTGSTPTAVADGLLLSVPSPDLRFVRAQRQPDAWRRGG
jgi:beta-lactamase class D